MKRSLKEEASEFAQNLLRNPTRRPRTEQIVRVLTQQHGGKFPVAPNCGTRPAIGRFLKANLGEEKYNELCYSSSSPKPIVPSLPQCETLPAPPRAPTLKALQKRFPGTATELLSRGAQLIDLLDAAEVAQVVAHLARPPWSAQRGSTVPGERSLTPSQGNGRQGIYHTLAIPLPPILEDAVQAAKAWIEECAGPLKKPLGSKTLLLRYGLDGENYAHHDDSGDFQALLVLSAPGVDYNGGEFYLADRNPPFDQTLFPFSAAGQLLVFRGNPGFGTAEYLHGMRPVTKGTGDETQRFAVGMFQ